MATGVSFIEGIGSVNVANGLAHFDLLTVIPPTAEGEQPRVMVAHHCVMALPQFVQLCVAMEAHLRGMEEKGIIRKEVG